MRYFSTFSGIGGFEIGIYNAYRSKVGGIKADTSGDQRQRLFTSQREDTATEKGRDSERTNDLTYQGSLHVSPPHCVGYSEIDPACISVYERNIGGTNYGDITRIDADKLPDFDYLVGGFPCQSFSLAGLRGGFADTRGTLFFDLARILEAKRPPRFVFENVKGLLSHDDGKTFRTIITTLDELGYDLQWQVLNSKNFGVPHNRERIYIVGHRRGTPRPKVFPLTDGSHFSSKKQSTRDNNVERGEDKEADPSGVRETTGISRHLDGERVISDTGRYKMLGNAVTTNVVQAIFEKLL